MSTDDSHTGSTSTSPSQHLERHAYSLALLLFAIYGLLLVYVIIRNEPIASPVFAVVIRTFTALIAGLLAAALPGTIIVRADLPTSAGGKLGVQAVAGVAFAVLAYIFTPEIYPDTFPVKFNREVVEPESQPSAELTPIPGDGLSQPDQRRVEQLQSWKLPLAESFALNGNKLAVFRSKFDRAYDSFDARVVLKPARSDRRFESYWNEVFAMEPGLAFVVRHPDLIERQLQFEVFIDGQGQNPNNDNFLKIERVDSSSQLLLIVPFSSRSGRDEEFNAQDVTKLIEVVNLDFRDT